MVGGLGVGGTGILFIFISKKCVKLVANVLLLREIKKSTVSLGQTVESP